MEGYATSRGYMGLVSGHWMLFVSDSEYHEYLRERENEQAHNLYKTEKERA